MRKSFKINYYFTLQEIIEFAYIQEKHLIDKFSFYNIPSLDIIKSNLIPANNANELLDPMINELWQSIIARYYDDYVIMISEDDDTIPSLTWENISPFFNKLINTITRTKDYYLTLLNIYNNQKNNLLNQVKSISTNTTRFNDTPQNGGEFVNDMHTSEFTKVNNSIESDVNTLMYRINEIQRLYRNVMKDWVDEFEKLFIERGDE